MSESGSAQERRDARKAKAKPATTQSTEAKRKASPAAKQKEDQDAKNEVK